MVDELPDATSEERIVVVNRLPVFAQVAGAVAHRVAVFAKEERLCVFRVGAVIAAPLRRRVHMALDVDDVALLHAVRVAAVRALVVDEARQVAALDPSGHGLVVLAVARLVAERPHDDRRVVLVALYHAASAVDIRLGPVLAVGKSRPIAVNRHAVSLNVSLITDIEPETVAQQRKTRVVRIVRRAYHVDIVRFHDIQVAYHMVERGGVTEQRVAVMAVNALGFDLLSVNVDYLV